jgi:hypothetical protein
MFVVKTNATIYPMNKNCNQEKYSIMHKKPLNSKGFGLVEVLLVVVALVVVAAGGIYVYHQDHKAKPQCRLASRWR